MAKNKPKTTRQNLEHTYFKDFKPKTRNQSDYLRAMAENHITFIEGPAGSGKTYLAIALACQYLLEARIDKVLVCRSIIACDNELGFMPGGVDEKIAPYMLPYLEYFNDFIGPDKTEKLIHYNQISLYPVELLRGHTYNKTFMILDEATNCTEKQVKLFLTRMGFDSKVVMIGDAKQSDIGRNGFDFCVRNMVDMDNVAVVKFDKLDILRHPVIPHILDVFDKYGI